MKIELEVAPEMYALGQGLTKFHAAIKQALADGWQAGQDLPVVLASAVGDLAPVLQGVSALKDEEKDAQSFANALYAGISPIVFSYVK